MSIKRARVLILLAACLAGLMGCSSAMKIGDFGKPNDGAASNGAASDGAASNGAASNGELPTGSVVVPPAESGPSGETIAPLAKPGLLGSDLNDDVQLGKKYFRSNNFGLAEKSFRSAAEHHPRDAEAWVGLAASYDRLHRFDLADRAYQEAIRIVGPTPEILNNQGFSYMLRGDYARAKKKLQDAQAKDPGNSHIQANMRLLEDSYREGKSVL